MLKHKTFKGFQLVLIGTIVQLLFKIGTLSVLAGLVAPREFGVMGIVTILFEFSKMLTSMGFGPAVVQRPDLRQEHLVTGFTLSLAGGLLLGTILWLTGPWIAAFFEIPELTDILKFLPLVFLLESFTLIGQALLQREMKFRIIISIELVSYIVGFSAVGIILGYLGWGVWALVLANIAQTMLTAILVTLFQPFPKKLFIDKAAMRDLFFYGSGTTLAKFGNYLATQGDNIIVGRTLGMQALGIYGRAYQFMVMPVNLFGNTLDKTLFPAMAKVQDDRQRLGKAYLTGVGLISIVAVPSSIILISVSKEIVLVVLGETWLGVVVPFQILASGLLFRMSYKVSESLTRATGAVYERMSRQFIYASLIFGGSYLGQFYGLPGVALGVVGALFLNFFFMAQLSLSITGMRWSAFFRAHLGSLYLGIVAFGVTLAFLSSARWADLPPWATLIWVLAGAGGAVALIAYVFRKSILGLSISDLLDELIIIPLRARFGSMIRQKQAETNGVIPAHLSSLFQALEKSGVVYCTLKSDPDHLNSAWYGNSDIDLLVAEKSRGEFRNILGQEGFKFFAAVIPDPENLIEDHFVWDSSVQRLIHLHVHFKLHVGKAKKRRFNLDLEAVCLKHRVFLKAYGVYVPSPAFGLVFKLIEASLDSRTYPEEIMKSKSWAKPPESALTKECAALWTELSMDEEQAYRLAEEMEYRKVSKGSLMAIRKLFHQHEIRSGAVDFAVRLRIRVRKFLWRFFAIPSPVRRINPRGGRVIAVVGADGSGKSTVTYQIRQIFGQKVDVLPIYFGRGDGGHFLLLSLFLGLKKRFQKNRRKYRSVNSASSEESQTKPPGKTPSLMNVVEAWLLIVDKTRKLKRLRRARSFGQLVICDRFPQCQIMQYNDGPLLSAFLKSGNPLLKRLARKEEQLFKTFDREGPDQLFRLITDPEVNWRRKPGETDIAILRTKIDGLRSLHYPQSTVVEEIDVAQPLNVVLDEVFSRIWKKL